MKIGVSVKNKISEGSCGNYVRWIESAGKFFQSEILFHEEKNQALKNFESCDALLLSGGEDVTPSLYGQAQWKEVADCNRSRDDFEFELLERSRSRKIPVFGICRGIQIANVFFGGTLIQDIEKVGKTNHKKISGQQDKIHTISVDENSHLFQALGEKNVDVNSSHHQSADKIGKDLKVVAKSEDGIVEALEWENSDGKFPLMLVQWHPERMTFQSKPSKNLLIDFIRQVKEYYKI